MSTGRSQRCTRCFMVEREPRMVRRRRLRPMVTQIASWSAAARTWPPNERTSSPQFLPHVWMDSPNILRALARTERRRRSLGASRSNLPYWSPPCPTPPGRPTFVRSRIDERERADTRRWCGGPQPVGLTSSKYRSPAFLPWRTTEPAASSCSRAARISTSPCPSRSAMSRGRVAPHQSASITSSLRSSAITRSVYTAVRPGACILEDRRVWFPPNGVFGGPDGRRGRRAGSRRLRPLTRSPPPDN